MRVRVPVAIRNRLHRLEGIRRRDVPRGDWPAIMELDEWEALASRMQDELSMSARGDLSGKIEVPAHSHAPNH